MTLMCTQKMKKQESSGLYITKKNSPFFPDIFVRSAIFFQSHSVSRTQLLEILRRLMRHQNHNGIACSFGFWNYFELTPVDFISTLAISFRNELTVHFSSSIESRIFNIRSISDCDSFLEEITLCISSLSSFVPYPLLLVANI